MLCEPYKTFKYNSTIPDLIRIKIENQGPTLFYYLNR